MGCLRTEALSDLNPTGIYYRPTVFWGSINMGQVPPHQTRLLGLPVPHTHLPASFLTSLAHFRLHQALPKCCCKDRLSSQRVGVVRESCSRRTRAELVGRGADGGGEGWARCQL